MNDKIKSFVLYSSYWPNIQMLTNEQLGLLFRALYHDFLELPAINLSDYPDVRMAFSFISDQLHRDKAKYDDVVQKRSQAGVASGKRRREQKNKMLNTFEQAEQMFDMSDCVQHNMNGYGDVTNNVDMDKNMDGGDDDVTIGLSTSQQNQIYYEIMFFRNLAHPRHECERFVQYYSRRNWTLERGRVLSTIEERIERARTWTPEDVKGVQYRVDPTFLHTWKRVYLLAKKNGAPAEVLSLMLNEGVSLEKSNMNPNDEHRFLCPLAVSEYLNRSADDYSDIYEEYRSKTKTSKVYITSIDHRH